MAAWRCAPPEGPFPVPPHISLTSSIFLAISRVVTGLPGGWGWGVEAVITLLGGASGAGQRARQRRSASVAAGVAAGAAAGAAWPSGPDCLVTRVPPSILLAYASTCSFLMTCTPPGTRGGCSFCRGVALASGEREEGKDGRALALQIRGGRRRAAAGVHARRGG